jgi:hypothetical protein
LTKPKLTTNADRQADEKDLQQLLGKLTKVLTNALCVSRIHAAMVTSSVCDRNRFTCP